MCVYIKLTYIYIIVVYVYDHLQPISIREFLFAS